jgi:DNA-binding PadR family transcriptional regulator
MTKERKRVIQAPKYLNLKGFLCFQILGYLGKKPSYGDELAGKIGGRKYGKLTPGTIYPALGLLRKRKLVRAKISGRKIIYSLTERGKTEYRTSKKILNRIFKGIL